MNKLMIGVVLSLSVAGQASAAPMEVKATNTWKGSIADANLSSERPESGVIANATDFEKLFKAWNVAEKVPAIDFDKELVLVETTSGGTLNVRATLDENGNLKVVGIATRDFRPGFRYMIISVSKQHVKTVNGKALPK
jgi:hypothetical protein